MTQRKAVGLISGGLDSTLAAKIIKDLGFDVYGVYFSMPWGCCDKTKAIEAAQKIGINFIVLQLDERYLKMVENPKHGYGSVLNPCVDCRIHMFGRAAQYMKEIEADFVFTGEVLGQRNMSQRHHSMKWVEKGSNLEGRLLRPLCAQHLEPTIPEKEGIIDRNKLLDISGRSRKRQMELADEFEITNYPQPAGGCLLTNEDFAKKMKDTFKYGYRDFRETIALKWGRHFRVSEKFKLVLGRDIDENINLIRYAHRDDHILQLVDEKGPTLILKGENPSPEILAFAAGIIQRYSKYKDAEPQQIKFWKNSQRNEILHTTAKKVTDQELEPLAI